MFENANHPGADIEIVNKVTKDVLREFQLKATESVSYVNAHFAR